MLKRELIAALAGRHPDLTFRDIETMARLVFESMSQALVEGRDIELRGFGSFRQRHYPPRAARNPGTGESVELGPRRGVLFRPGLSMRERINDGE